MGRIMTTDYASEAEEATPQTIETAPEQDTAESQINAIAANLMGGEDGEEPEGTETPTEADAAEEKTAEVSKIKIGEEELTIEEIKNSMLRDKDYRQKTQALAEQRKELEAFGVIAERMKSDPAYFDHVLRKYEPPASPKPPEDPIEALKWEMKQELMKEFAPHIQKLEAKQFIDSVRADFQRDPIFDEVQGAIQGYVKGLPEDEQAAVYTLLDTNPKAYAKRYAHARQWIMSQKEAAAKEAPEAKTEKAELPTSTSRKERAPVLEQSGRTVPTASEESDRAKTKAKLYRQIKSGEASGDELADYLMMMPGFEKLIS